MTLRPPWETAGCEPSIGDLLSDPIAQALMLADGVAEHVVIAIMRGLNSHPGVRRAVAPVDGALARYCQRLAGGSLPHRVTEELVAIARQFDPEAAVD